MNRRLMLSASIAAIAAALGLKLADPFAPDGPPLVETAPDRLLALIAAEFGDAYAADDEAKAFAEEFAARQTLSALPEAHVVFAFIRATNVIRALETGESLTYVGLEDLRESPCRNTLSSWWL